MTEREVLNMIYQKPGIGANMIKKITGIRKNHNHIIENLINNNMIIKHRHNNQIAYVISEKGLKILYADDIPNDKTIIGLLKKTCRCHPDLLDYLGTDNPKNPYMIAEKTF